MTGRTVPLETGETIGFKPLYAQVRDRLVRRMIDGEWVPGMALPSEMELARQLNVSQGTVRKALDSMTADNLLVRRQGRGTFVAELEESRILFQFFRLIPDSGTPEFPESEVLSRRLEKATQAEAAALAISTGDMVYRIERLRFLSGVPALTELITLPARRFPGISDIEPLPNNVYRLYSDEWGITVAASEEKLKAIAASATDADRLKCDEGEPLLMIVRLALDLEGRPVEVRTSRCLTRSVHYGVHLR